MVMAQSTVMLMSALVYIVTVYAEQSGERSAVKSTLVHVLPREGHKLPEQPYGSTARTLLVQPTLSGSLEARTVRLDASGSQGGSSPIARYQWDISDRRSKQ